MRWKPAGSPWMRKRRMGERHHLGAFVALGAVVLPIEGDAVEVGRDEPAVGDGDAVGVARHIYSAAPVQGRRMVSLDAGGTAGLAWICSAGASDRAELTRPRKSLIS